MKDFIKYCIELHQSDTLVFSRTYIPTYDDVREVRVGYVSSLNQLTIVLIVGISFIKDLENNNVLVQKGGYNTLTHLYEPDFIFDKSKVIENPVHGTKMLYNEWVVYENEYMDDAIYNISLSINVLSNSTSKDIVVPVCYNNCVMRNTRLQNHQIDHHLKIRNCEYIL